jgi:hypothetical protein
MDDHHRRHYDERRFKCAECPYRAVSSTNLARHKMIHQERGYECDICKKKFVYKGHLNRHRVIHTGQKNFACSQCSYICNVPSNLRKHLSQVHKIKLPREGKIVRVTDISLDRNNQVIPPSNAVPTQFPDVHHEEAVLELADQQMTEGQTASMTIMQMSTDTKLQPPTYTYNMVQIPGAEQYVSEIRS